MSVAPSLPLSHADSVAQYASPAAHIHGKETRPRAHMAACFWTRELTGFSTHKEAVHTFMRIK
ncbi:MAG: hypothetical protein NWS81_00245, partial [Litorivicinaceae bacterium]|nr:hypothetical protein [Litorivicinaceae bacterium]MDP5328225.1 hypothetical protein [Litorivicinaceae bacterium]MDP5329789.1 hypothetical protein [Litorivicinaceae bacterium]MDP5341358.1 hypothetical protein [Litorivicinaceae bacterium]MDP5343007.1 hypothetical protein [Litorivicinaceae bacterium]